MTSRFATVSCARLSVPLHTPFVTALRRTTTTDTVVVRVTDSEGTTGWGEAPQVWQVTGESLAGATACVEQMLAPCVVRHDVDDWEHVLAGVQRAVARNYGAKAAVDTAIRDLVARRAGQTLAEHLRTTAPGGALGAGDVAYPSVLRTDVTLSAGDPADLAAAAVQRVSDGFTTLKMKVGTDAATDVARVRAVREAVGPQVTIRLDANQGWTPDDAVAVIRALEDADLGVELVEQPVAGEDVEGLASVRARVGLPVMADESLYSLVDLDRIIRARGRRPRQRQAGQVRLPGGGGGAAAPGGGRGPRDHGRLDDGDRGRRGRRRGGGGRLPHDRRQRPGRRVVGRVVAGRRRHRVRG